jgi:hypothetical protein
VTLSLLASTPARAQVESHRLDDLTRGPLVLDGFSQWSTLARIGDDSTTARSSRFRLPGMSTGFLTAPTGLDLDDDGSAVPLAGSFGPWSNDPSGDWLQVALGRDNGLSDLTWPGRVGGRGFYRLDSQVRVADTGTTGLALGFEAITPAGPEDDGILRGPTILRPALALSHEFETGTVVHTFIGSDVRTDPGWVRRVGRGPRCGLAVEQPISDDTPGTEPDLFLSLAFLGKSVLAEGGESEIAWKLVPTLRYQLSENMWFSGGYIFPVNSERSDARSWMMMCSWRF